jgi:methyltransferase (TIGR00027 family)
MAWSWDMQQAKPSRTGELTAIMRAIHQTADEEPKILADSIAPRLVDTTGGDEWLASSLGHPFAKQWRAGFLIRNRYAEDCLAEGVERGLQQYAILGAGLDTFAFRQPPWARPLSIYEIDHPATQRWKCDRLAAAGIAIPPNLTFVSIDFERAFLTDALRAANFDFGSKTFCSWLGVTQYLTPDAVQGTLEFVLSLPRSSEIVFSFVLPLEMLPKVEGEARAMAEHKSAQVGEPYLTTFRAEDLKAQLWEMGFSNVIHLTPEEVHERYLKNRRDGLKARLGEQLIRAIV